MFFFPIYRNFHYEFLPGEQDVCQQSMQGFLKQGQKLEERPEWQRKAVPTQLQQHCPGLHGLLSEEE